ncbi:hypothetical protein [uncultured Clostridium sp.]|nr:hypothetical protein [uncultured Clostridium sp.]
MSDLSENFESAFEIGDENKIGGKFATNTYILHTHPKYHSDR